jgi:hypothetical protein
MKEHYLHFLWKMKRFNSPYFKLEDGRELKIIRFGYLNQNFNGPDFNDCIIEFDNMQFYGNIEMHVKSSDWYLHKHHLDDLYQSVILHVVYENDKDVSIKDYPLPTLVVKPYIDPVHYRNYLRFFKTNNVIACHKQITNHHLDPFVKEDLIYQRMMTKISRIEPKDHALVFYELILTAMARNIHKECFNHLLERTQTPFLKYIQKKKTTLFKELLDEKMVVEFKSLSYKKGFFPKGNPFLKLQEIMKIELTLFTDFSWIDLSVEEIKGYFYVFFLNKSKVNFSKDYINHLLINAIVPFLCWLGEVKRNEMYQAKAIDLLLRLPPEQNAIIKNWKKTGLFVHSSYDTQVLLELFKNKCLKKDCLNCKIGYKLLNK